MSFSNLVPILQGSIGPVILISGVGLLLLSMTNRIGRVVDRSRQLAEQMRKSQEPVERRRLSAELDIVYSRARLLRTAVTLATVSVLCAALLVISLFVTAIVHVEPGFLGAAFFIACMVSLILSLIYFLKDINLSLAALKLTIQSVRQEAGK